jgi:hypothetical protein
LRLSGSFCFSRVKAFSRRQMRRDTCLTGTRHRCSSSLLAPRRIVSKPRLGIGFEGILFVGRLRSTDRVDLDRALGSPPAPGSIAALLRLMPQADIAVYPLWPARGRAAFISRWLKRRLSEHLHDDPGEAARAVAAALRAIEIADRRPDDLDAVVEFFAVSQLDGVDPLSWAPIDAAMQRGWALERA